MNSLKIIKELEIYLKTIPEIKSCSIELSPNDICLKNINNTDFVISIMSHYSDKKISPKMFSELIEANIKHSRAMEVSNLLYQLYTDFLDFFTNRSSYFNENLIKQKVSYSAEGII